MRAHLKTALSSLFSFARSKNRRTPITTTAAAVVVALGMSAPALAQQAIVQPGFAAVTGFGGYVANPPPPGGDPTDYLTDNLNGPSARVVDLTVLGPQGNVSNAPKPFTVFTQQVGQVFGVTLDDAQSPNIYLAATSAYGLSIAIPDSSGQMKRVRAGTPGAQFVPGQFGPQTQNGGPGSIWKVDGVTGQVLLFATVDGGVGSVAALGALAYDPQSRQIFASERGTGIIYRIGLNGAIAGTYDHGTEGRPGAGLGPIGQAPSAPVDIQNPAFDTGNPMTWGIAAPARRTYALAVRNQRLYYSVAQGPQVWSAPIGPGGVVSGSGARVEVDVPSLADGVEIASIAFDGAGNMYLAERGATTGDYALTQLANPSQSRVLRFVPKQPGDPSPGLWRLNPDQYSIGLPPAYANANGGVALNYGYGYDGRVNPSACGATLWSTGERLLDPGNGSSGFPTVDGLQGNDTSLYQPQNTPPTQSWFVDYDDQPGDPNFRGYMGAIATVPCGGIGYVPPPVYCPPGTYFANGQCLLIPVCPAGTYYHDGVCSYPNCPPNTYRDRDNRCVPPPQTCPRDSFYYNGRCVPFCPPDMRRLPNGYCGCPPDMFYRDGRCVPPQFCPPRTHYDPRYQTCIPDCRPGEQYDWRNNRCIPHCPPNTQYDPRQDRCVPQCPPNTRYNPDLRKCVPQCPPNTEYDPRLDRCVPHCPPDTQYDPRINQCVPHCPPNTQYNPDLRKCVPHCPPDTQYDPRINQCVPHCPPNTEYNSDLRKCVPHCPPNTRYDPRSNQCVPQCPPNNRFDPNQQRCVPVNCGPGITSIPGCGPGPGPVCDLSKNDKIGNQCLPKCGPNQFRDRNTLQCVFKLKPDLPLQPVTPTCSSREELINGKCVLKCRPGEQRVNGQCVRIPGNDNHGNDNNQVFKPLLPNNGNNNQGFKPIVPLEKPACDLSTHDMVGGKCLPKCGADQFRGRNGQCVDKKNDIPPPKMLKTF